MTPPPYTPEGDTREQVYRFVRGQLEAGRSPTLREVQAEFGFRAVETVRRHLSKLVDEGRLTKNHGARGYALPERARVSMAMVPLLGRVPAGELAEAIETSAAGGGEGSIPVELPTRGTKGGDLFALRVQGESMKNAGILDGDIVVVRAQATARSGEIVVAMVGDEATVKTLKRVMRDGRRRVELHPENPRFRPIVPAEISPAQGGEDGGSEFRILGRVVEVRRRLV